MLPVPFIPATAPFTAEQRAWLNGYLAGLFAYADGGEPAPARAGTSLAQSGPPKPLVILFGSQTGTAEHLAKRLAGDASKRGYQPRVQEMNAFASIDLSQERHLVLVTSTWGDGDPPDNAVGFWNYLNSEQAPKLDHLAYSVLALGDSNYTEFCGAGKKFDARLEALGAKRIHPRADCDTDYEAPAQAWMEGLWPVLEKETANTRNGAAANEDKHSDGPSEGRNGVVVHEDLAALAPPRFAVALRSAPDTPAPAVFNRQNPFPARLITNRRLNGPGSEKDTRHFEISLAGSGLSYEVGDALGVMPANCPQLVDEILRALGCDGEEAVKDAQGGETSLRVALLRHFQITQIPPALLRAFAERAGDSKLQELLEPARQVDLDKYLQGRDLLDLLREFPAARFSAPEFSGLLRKLQPRLYSISSSLKAHADQVHLTVGVVRFESHGRLRKGVCSTFLAERVETETPVPVFIQKSANFRLPEKGQTPVIMIGPGTGIAPFRAFLEERRTVGATGRNWLFFGDQRQALDFLYRDELEAMQNAGILSRLDTAFSRDQMEKIYVPHRLRENAREIWAWLEAGAHVYVCGDAKRMAKDVEAALLDVIQGAGAKPLAEAEAYLAMLKKKRRYQRDVY